MSDQEGKAVYIAAFFDDLERKVAFLQELWVDGRQDEALTLCCCYIDGLGSRAATEDHGSARGFVDVLLEHGGEPSLGLYLPLALRRFFQEQDTKKYNAAGDAIEAALGDSLRTLVSESELAAALRAKLDVATFVLAEKNLWRCSVAAIVYKWVRSPSVHSLGGPSAVVVGSTGTPPREVSVGFPVLYPVLQRIVGVMRERSTDSTMWFGHDGKSSKT
jgi:hypothetical protein